MGKQQRFVGLDIETSGLDPATDSILQVAITDGARFEFSSDIGWPQIVAETAHPAALQVNGFTAERIMRGPNADKVDEELSEYIATNFGYTPYLTAVGWNVGSFDLAFIKKALPCTHRAFTHRAADLNSMIYLLAGEDGDMFESIKSSAKKAAESILKGSGNRHDALYDARAALLEFDYLRKEIS